MAKGILNFKMCADYFKIYLNIKKVTSLKLDQSIHWEKNFCTGATLKWTNNKRTTKFILQMDPRCNSWIRTGIYSLEL